jgi:two-component system, OmpR family, KDP operon response regulator KdpE
VTDAVGDRVYSSARSERRVFTLSVGNSMNSRASRPRTLVLALSDEVQLQRLLRSILEPTGCKVVAAPLSALESPPTERPDVVIVDLDHLDPRIASWAKQRFFGAEILQVCNNYREEDGIAVLEIGGDYLARPFRAQDLVAKVHAAELHRLATKGCRRYYRAGGLVIDLLAGEVARDGRRFALTFTELRILEVLAREAGGVATTRQILYGLRRPESLRDRQALRMFVYELRRKLESDPRRASVLLNEARVGYRLVVEPGGPALIETDMRVSQEITKL